MTTAHRATWYTAIAPVADFGNWSSGGVRSGQVPSRDLPNHLAMKYRSGDQLPTTASKADADDAELRARPDLLLEADPELKKKYDDKDEEDEDSSDDSSDSDSDDDEELAVAVELAKIKREREEEARRQEAQQRRDAKAEADIAALTSNPLLNATGAIKRKWNDDVVFRNQARHENKPKKRFINDTIRNDFHKRFLQKYVH
eukprot:CAMPEP_0118917860 /NCGR_PEP_ID=MMETSP1166-20130328/17570_1 /TAXON_ID=1104430 /ORGANISM="Chrysoreinhardia sp, Strain CCMP3193" /LENGTH=200 /DNA_ID=CAMNT_0006858083 /DNA_START=26 /DNA_END=628 /DNA_ORIENTATION=+